MFKDMAGWVLPTLNFFLPIQIDFEWHKEGDCRYQATFK
jgi:hypothetical protein